MKAKTNLKNFNNLKRKKSFLNLFVFTIWYFIKILIFNTPFPWPYILKNNILRIFGAKIGNRVIIKPRVNIHIPWNLKIGNFSWIGEEVNIINFAKVEIGSNACISQQVLICSGSHDFRNHSFIYRHKPISIGDGVWLQARVFVAPGTVIEDEVVVYPNSLAKGRLEINSIYSDNNLKKTGVRWKL